VIPAVISATVLPRLIPRAAGELFLTGATFDGTRAAEIGLVTRAVPAADLDATVAEYAAALIRGAPGALAAAKRLTRRGTNRPIREELAELTELSVRFFTSDEGREGVLSYLEKRDPAWIPS
jgi:methylglutaconyl-CoA hydratase